ncbi:MAG: hypothetical protein HY986_18600 [Candidatus Melainabacteria bacterium]|nr:hypothetical protein [Candidatus Melainabacteria bacterium]
MSFSQSDRRILEERGLDAAVIDEIGKSCCSPVSLFEIGADGFAPHYKTFPTGPSREELEEELRLLSQKSLQYPELAETLEKKRRAIIANYFQSDADKLYDQLRWAGITEVSDAKLQRYADLLVKYLRTLKSDGSPVRGKGFLQLTALQEALQKLDSEISRLEGILEREDSNDDSNRKVHAIGFRNFSNKRRSFAFKRLLELRRLLESHGYVAFGVNGLIGGEILKFETESMAWGFINYLREGGLALEGVSPRYSERQQYSYRTTEELINYPSGLHPIGGLEKLDDGSWIKTVPEKYEVYLDSFAVILMNGVAEVDIPAVMDCSHAPDRLSSLLAETAREVPFETLECDRRSLCLAFPSEFSQIEQLRSRFQDALGELEKVSVDFDYDGIAERKMVRVDFF